MKAYFCSCWCGLVTFVCVVTMSVAPFVHAGVPVVPATSSTWKPPAAAQQVLPNGVRLVVAEKHTLPLVAVVVTVSTGSALLGPGKSGLAALAAQAAGELGTKNLDVAAFARAFEALGAQLNVSAGEFATRFEFTVVKQHLPAALALVSDALVAPRFANTAVSSDREFDRLKQRVVAELQTSYDEPKTLAALALRRSLWGTEHPLAASPHGVPTSVAALSLADARSYWQQNVVPARVSIVLSGDVTLSSASALLAPALGSWKPASTTPPPAKAAAAPASVARVVLIDWPGAPQSVIRVGQVLPPLAVPAGRAATLVLSTALGGSFTSRLVQNLREKHGYTYGAQAVVSPEVGFAVARIATSVRSDATAPSVQEILAEMAGIQQPMGSDELAKAKALVANAFVETAATTAGVADQLASEIEAELPAQASANIYTSTAAVSAESARAAARAFAPELSTMVVVGDLKTISASVRLAVGSRPVTVWTREELLAK